jgi:hypothetical protein
MAAKTKEKPPGLFAEFEPPTDPPRSEPRTPIKGQARIRPLLLETAKSLRAAAQRDGDSVFAAIACGVWTLTDGQVRGLAEVMADELERECQKPS